MKRSALLPALAFLTWSITPALSVRAARAETINQKTTFTTSGFQPLKMGPPLAYKRLV